MNARGNDLSFLVLMVALILLVSASADIRRDCRRESKVSWGSLKKLKAGDFNQNDPALKCYLRCFMMKSGILNGNTEVDVQRALRHLPQSMQDDSRKLLNHCKSVSGTNPCDKAFQMAKCYVRSCPEILSSVPFV